jgi:hypothetical protein
VDLARARGGRKPVACGLPGGRCRCGDAVLIVYPTTDKGGCAGIVSCLCISIIIISIKAPLSHHHFVPDHIGSAVFHRCIKLQQHKQ